MPSELAILVSTAAVIGVVHTLLGPDHYVPFLALARARGWSLPRTLTVTGLCGLGHVAGSIVLGAVAIALGWAAVTVEWIEAARGDIAGWVLLGFGLAYTAWAVRRVLRGRPHEHWHTHADGTVHSHAHGHHGEHAHVHSAQGRARSGTAWALFVILVLGPCEPLVPLLMFPAFAASWGGLVLVTAVFAIATVGTMVAATWLGYAGLALFARHPLRRYGDVLAGVALIACGLAIRLGL